MINIHPALLPSFKGLDTHRRALEAGVRIHGCTVHFVTAEIDDGPIIAQAAVPVLTGDSEADARGARAQGRAPALSAGAAAGRRRARRGWLTGAPCTRSAELIAQTLRPAAENLDSRQPGGSCERFTPWHGLLERPIHVTLLLIVSSSARTTGLAVSTGAGRRARIGCYACRRGHSLRDRTRAAATHAGGAGSSTRAIAS